MQLSLRKAVPVVPGKVEPNHDPHCAACGHLTAYSHKEVHACIEMILCNNYVACNKRWKALRTVFAKKDS
jgi:hypothetical protein